MSSLREFEGKNLDEAVKTACDALNIARDKLRYNVVSHGSTGIFGLVGVKKAKINVTVAGIETREDDEPEVTTGSSPRPEPVFPDEAPIVKETADTDPETDASGNPVEIGQEALQQIIDTITSDAKISVEENGGRIYYHVEGGNPAILIGKRGQTLEAIQYLVEKIVNKQHANRVKIQVDVEKYLEKRRENLQAQALRLAEKTKKTGKPSTIGQMNAYERRIVHLALKEDKNVRTQSMGDGFIRKLVIFPKKNSNRRKRR